MGGIPDESIIQHMPVSMPAWNTFSLTDPSKSTRLELLLPYTMIPVQFTLPHPLFNLTGSTALIDLPSISTLPHLRGHQ